MTDHPAIIIPVTIGLIALSAFFVAVEFAMLAAKEHRLEDLARTSRPARAALRNSTELTVLLAGAQLGITAVTVALGAITKPAVHHWLMVPLDVLRLPTVVADVISFALALLIVTFVHLVVGEMAPKSWAIAHPERSAVLLAVPMRVFMAFTRPMLTILNGAANWCLKRVGVDPVDQIANERTGDELRHLVEHSANVGALDPGFSAQLTEALELDTLTLADVLPAEASVASVPPWATVADVQRVALESRHHRILVCGDDPVGVVHVRDTLTAPRDGSIEAMLRPALQLPATATVSETLQTMRSTSTQLAVVHSAANSVAGVVTITDVLRRLLPMASQRGVYDGGGVDRS